MKILTIKKYHLIYTLLSAVFLLSLAACSDDEKPTETKTLIQESPSAEKLVSVDSPHDSTPEATETQKQKFQHDFAAQCTERELNNSTNKIADAERLAKSCECISAYITKDLTDEEAEKFNTEHENPQSLRIKFEAAAYECIQEKAHVEGPKLNGKPE